MHEQTIGLARTTLERALECGRLIHQLAIQLDTDVGPWWAANDMPFSVNTAKHYRRLWVYRDQLATTELLTAAARSIRNLPAIKPPKPLNPRPLAPEIKEEVQALLEAGVSKRGIAKKLGVTWNTVADVSDPVRGREGRRRRARARSQRQRQALAEKRQIEREGKRALAARALQTDPDLSRAYSFLRRASEVVDATRVRAEGEKREHLSRAYGYLTGAETELVRALKLAEQ